MLLIRRLSSTIVNTGKDVFFKLNILNFFDRTTVQFTNNYVEILNEQYKNSGFSGYRRQSIIIHFQGHGSKVKVTELNCNGLKISL